MNNKYEFICKVNSYIYLSQTDIQNCKVFKDFHKANSFIHKYNLSDVSPKRFKLVMDGELPLAKARSF